MTCVSKYNNLWAIACIVGFTFMLLVLPACIFFHHIHQAVDWLPQSTDDNQYNEHSRKFIVKVEAVCNEMLHNCSTISIIKTASLAFLLFSFNRFPWSIVDNDIKSHIMTWNRRKSIWHGLYMNVTTWRKKKHAKFLFCAVIFSFLVLCLKG